MLEYSFRTLKLPSGRKRILIDFQEEQYHLLSTFLEMEVMSFYEPILEMLEKVLQGKSSEELFNGNLCTALFTPETTTISGLYSQNQNQEFCRMDTKELKCMLEIYVKNARK